MRCNVGTVDRISRIVLGIVILGVGYMMESLWGLVGLVPLLTGLFKLCPLYSIVGINSGCKTQNA